MKKILIAGGTGFIGLHLFERLKDKYALDILSRNPYKVKYLFGSKIGAINWDMNAGYLDLSDYHGVINLSGESIASGLWTKMKKKKILESRIRVTSFLSNSIFHSEKPPKVFLSASAIGYYGSKESMKFTENSAKGSGFLADVCNSWEEASKKINEKNTRKVILRIGGVLGKNGGMLKQMLLPFHFFAGGPIGSGKQYMSWIHIDDLIEAIFFLLENKSTKGIYNLTSPNPVTSKEMAKAIGKYAHRPSFIPFPRFAVKTIFGEMGKELLLADQYILPEKLLAEGFQFQFDTIDKALKNLIAEKSHS